MGRFVFVVQSDPTPGCDREYNEWYDGIHLKDVCSIPGFTGARRFRLIDGEGKNEYLALYELDTDDPQGALAALTAAALSGKVQMADALDLSKVSTALFEEIAEYRK